MKKFLLMALVLPLIANAQKKNIPDTLSFAEINNARNDKGLFDVGKIYETFSVPYNQKRMKDGNELINYINDLNTAYDNFKNSTYYIGVRNEFKSDIGNIKNKYPQLDISFYQKTYDNYFEKERQNIEELKKGDSIKQAILVQQDIDRKKRVDSLSKAELVESKQEQPDNDSIKYIEEDSNIWEVGTEAEWIMQHSYQTAINDYCCQFIGFKFYWVLNIAKFLQSENVGSIPTVRDDKKDTSKLYVDIYPDIASDFSNTGKLLIAAKINEWNRITSLKITGNKYLLTYLFLYFWPSSINILSKENMRQGHLYTKWIGLEKISFNYQDTSPYIVITKEKSINILK